MGDFDHIRPQFRAKVALDFLAHLDAEGHWETTTFDGRNDYQRHLYALFLRLAGKSAPEVCQVILGLSEDVAESRRTEYAINVVHSEIVGFQLPGGNLLELPNQAIIVAEFPSLAS